MWHAVSYALMDSINVLLIGVIVLLGVVLPPSARYRRIATLLVGGDWLGVFLLSVPVLLLLDSIRSRVEAALASPIFGWVLIAVGVVSAVMTWRGGDSTALMNRMLGPLRTPTWRTAAVGFVLGVVQSITSLPFFAGLAYLSTGGFSTPVRYLGLVFYASLALSLPALTAVAVGFVRAYPESPAGRAFAWSRENGSRVSQWAGYLVSVCLIVMGCTHL
ncbi:sulfite exporter TauE/SafE family protein [Corynebacterium epidermidicanis]|uniref:Putative DUF2910 family protein n=1 Tax=Corynebacterium epidermidicanis TaxID=1050174 RepID=A0A0G3GT57_9CORY|nr:membrane protein [Corynebacterium epidermidicanis]AKK02708.1 putative DUF2910 family protein [Corynebacterium epidermidicanis]